MEIMCQVFAVFVVLLLSTRARLCWQSDLGRISSHHIPPKRILVLDVWTLHGGACLREYWIFSILFVQFYPLLSSLFFDLLPNKKIVFFHFCFALFISAEA